MLIRSLIEFTASTDGEAALGLYGSSSSLLLNFCNFPEGK
ncbi:hypothetical protein Golax_016133 [Gossypium laxum]|uniref:Uncharacterized protein n=1 Tax=Gossypium laxum TaxID=34288 RepID=A0A7J8YXS9_9ROSI|nr:hypothetical protein [Gossypium laxum]